METWDTPSDWLVGWSAGWLAGVCLARKNQACVLSVDVLHAGPNGEDLRARREWVSEKHSLFLLDSLVNSMVADKKSLTVLSRCALNLFDSQWKLCGKVNGLNAFRFSSGWIL